MDSQAGQEKPPISETGDRKTTAEQMKLPKSEKYPFTLVEIIAVIAIMLVIAGIVTASALRKPSSITLKKSSVEISELLHNARTQAVLQNKLKYVFFDEKNNVFNIEGDKKNEMKVTLSPDMTVEISRHNKKQKWLYCFYPDGTGAGPELTLILKQYKVSVSISPLTGMVFSKETE